MSLQIGQQLSSYEITSLIGKGGMGEVYRAKDTKLKRDVAIKILPDEFSRDTDRVARFQREAEALAALNHQNIAAIYDLQQSDATRFLILEFVEGETLADILKQRGALPVDEALHIAKQIVEALEAAHEKGIVHRDLKPANVKITSDGKVKVLDFGLAKAFEAEATNSNLSHSPTLSMAATNAGLILGTAAYMSPEQAKGRTVDKRADIFAFGCVLYEMLTGRPAFDGEDVPDILSRVLQREPDWTLIPPNVRPRIRELLRLCLEKNAKNRRSDATDVRLDIEQALAEPVPVIPAATRTRSARLAWSAFAAALLVAVVLAIPASRYLRESQRKEPALRYTLAIPEDGRLDSMAISPDGRYVAIAAETQGKRQLWLRALDASQARALPATDGAALPFWSPDSRNIGFFAQGKLKRIAASGGPPLSLCDANPGGGSWNRENVIIFSPSAGGGVAIQRIPAAGGSPSEVTMTRGDYRFPIFLPDGDHFLYEVVGESSDKNGIQLSSLNSSESRRVLPDASSVVYSPSPSGSGAGHLLFIRENTLMAQPFDTGSARNTGDAFPVAQDVVFTSGFLAPITASDTGVLLYVSGGGRSYQPNQMVWLDRTGKLLGPVARLNDHDPSISPDEKTISLTRNQENIGAGYDVWLWDLARATETRLTFDGSANHPIWSPKGDRVAFSWLRGGRRNLYQKATSGSGESELLVSAITNATLYQWSRDGRFIVYSDSETKTKYDLWVLPIGERAPANRKPFPFLRTDFNEIEGQISPDGRWMAYRSDESGKGEVYVRPFPSGEGRWRISTAGGEQPRWRGDGKELFLLAGDEKMMATQVNPGPNGSFAAGSTMPLFQAHIPPNPSGVPGFQYDVTADGKRFLVNTTLAGANTAEAPATALNVVVHWNTGLRN